MAKSMRSKHRRRMRSVKREKFAKKDLVKLKATVMRDVINNKEVDMADIATVKTASALKDQPSTTSAQDGQMEIEGAKSYDKKKQTDEHGQYPVWMNQRAMRKQQVKNKKIKRGKGKKASAW
ncbi:protein LLP-like [Littorina saxatilis]|uniref:Uncharacterized protein n=1 Tax=Littorina saxatilis TaxID=31220 RepID=A0AAN9B9T7_9CAEN